VELPSGASTEVTQKLIEERLLELEWEPCNVQVVVGDNKQIFLVDREGVIVSTKHVSSYSTSHLHVRHTPRHVRGDHVGNNFNILLLSE